MSYKQLTSKFFVIMVPDYCEIIARLSWIITININLLLSEKRFSSWIRSRSVMISS